MISLDSETTGLDLNHGARPFFVTTCTPDGDQRYWQWDVDPLTREPQVPAADLREIGEYLFADGPHGPIGDVHADPDNAGLILQNAKFDFQALDTLGFWDDWCVDTAWLHVRDTLLAGHLLASNHPHDLTSMGIAYLGVNIEPFEKLLEGVTKKCRHKVQLAKLKQKRGGDAGSLAEWAIAEAGRPDMPSAGATVWKYDTWLPLAYAKHFGIPQPSPVCEHVWDSDYLCARCTGYAYWIALRDYANADSAVTVSLWQRQLEEIKRRKLLPIYMERLKVLPVAYGMQNRGVTISEVRLEEQKAEYAGESLRLGAECKCIAAGLGYDLELPTGSAVNGSLRTFFKDVLKVEPYHNPKARTAEPTLNKEAMGHYAATLPPEGEATRFVNALLDKRARDTALTYMNAYSRFWIPVHTCWGAKVPSWYTLHPFLNPTGTDTLRWSSEQPNEQNISKRKGFNLRNSFGPAPGREWWSMDARGIEDRLPAYKSGQKELIEIFEDPDKPPYYGSNHLLRFSIVYPDLWEDAVKKVGLDQAGPYCKKEYASTYYQWDKNGGFAVQYGAVDKKDSHPDRPETWGTADRAFHKYGAHRLLTQRLSKLEALNQQCITFASVRGYIETMPDKTVDPHRGYPLLCTRTERGGIKPTVPLNYYIQGTAMWWMMKAMIRCEQQLAEWRKAGFDSHIALQVHDELVFDFPKRAHPKADAKRSNLWRTRKLQALMQQGGDDIGIPTPTSMEYHEVSWAEGVGL